MKRIDEALDDENLIELMHSDPVGRNSDLADLAGIIGSIEGGYSLFLDSDWGTGKTTFVKQLAYLLRMSNQNLDTSDNASRLIEEGSELSVFKDLSSFLPVYYNAWGNDYWDDPLPSIAATVASGTDASFENETTVWEKVTAICDGVLSIMGMGGATAVREGFEGKDLLEHYKNRVELRGRITELIGLLLPETANTLLLIIDELDRCKPSFALKILEEMKSLFVDDRVIILYSVNTSQLAIAIEGYYGSGFDGRKYLSRFYDLSIPLRKVTKSDYLKLKGVAKTSNRFDIIAHEMVDAYSMSMRDINRYYALLDKARKVIGEGRRARNDEPTASLANVGVVPVVLAMKVARTDSYERLIRYGNVEELMNSFELCASAMKFLDQVCAMRLLGNIEQEPDEQSKEKARRTMLEALVHGIWLVDKESSPLIDSYRLVDDGWALEALPDLAKLM